MESPRKHEKSSHRCSDGRGTLAPDSLSCEPSAWQASQTGGHFPPGSAGSGAGPPAAPVPSEGQDSGLQLTSPGWSWDTAEGVWSCSLSLGSAETAPGSERGGGGGSPAGPGSSKHRAVHLSLCAGMGVRPRKPHLALGLLALNPWGAATTP